MHDRTALFLESLCLSPQAPRHIAGFDGMFTLPDLSDIAWISLVPIVMVNGKLTNYHVPSHCYP
jgi:hypothetical protein